MSKEDKVRLSRRNLLKAAAGAAAAIGAPASAGASNGRSRGRDDDNDHAKDLVFVNGKIHTMDDDNSVVRSVRIRNGKFIAVGRDADDGPDAKVIDLRGRTVVPGLIESHVHFVSLANRPGYHVAGLELASNI